MEIRHLSIHNHTRVWYNEDRKANEQTKGQTKMWEVKVRITMMNAEVKEWMDEETEEVVRSVEWGEEETAATLKVRIDHTGIDEQGEYLPDDEVTHDKVHEEVEKWQQQTGLVDDEVTIMSRYYDPEKAKKVK